MILLDTSFLVDPVRFDGEASISVISIAELSVGVLTAKDTATRSLRLARLTEIERGFEALPVDRAVAEAYSTLVASARDRGVRPRTADALIAATALANDLVLWTRDADFSKLAGLKLRLVPV